MTAQPLSGDGDDRPWVRPGLARLGRVEAADSRRLHLGRAAVEFPFGGTSLRLTLASPRAIMAAGLPTTQFTLAIGGRIGLLGLHQPLLRLLLASIDAADAERHPDLDLLVEAALAAPLAALERELGQPVAILPAESSLPADLRLLGFHVARGDTGLGVLALRLARPDLVAVTGLLDRLPARPTDPDPLTIGLVVEAGSVVLPVGVIEQLDRDDVLLSDDGYPPDGAAVVVAGQRRLLAEKAPGGWRITAATARYDEGPTAMDDVKNETLPEPGFDDLSVRVVFEMGRQELPLAELRRIRPGYVLELDRPAGLVVDLTVRGQRIGKGELVQVDNCLGVRLLRLFGHE